MKIFLITRENLIAGMAAASRVRCYSKALLQSDVKLEVLLIKQSLNSEAEKTGRYEGIPYRVMGEKVSENKRDISRYVGYLVSDFAMIRYLRENVTAGDVVFEFGSTLFHTFLLIRLAHQKKACFIRDLCELPCGTGKESFLTKVKRIILLKRQFRMYDGVIAISDNLVELAKQYVSPACQIIKVPILVEYEKFKLESNRPDNSNNYIFHSGTLYEQKDGIVSMIRAFADFKKKDIHKWKFVSTGNINSSPHSEEIKEIIQRNDIEESVVFTGYLSSEDLKMRLQNASLVIINKYDNQQNKYCFSTKLAEYMAAGKAIIITKVGEATNWLENEKDALLINPSNNEELVAAMLRLAEDSELRRKIGEAARATCQLQFDYNVWKEPLYAFVSKVSEKNKA